MLSSPAPMRELADNLACDRSYITGLADKLEERGVVISRLNEDERRMLEPLLRRLLVDPTGKPQRPAT